MIPKITGGGASFQGAFRYYLHDKGAETSSRVAWTQTVNLRSPDVSKAWKMMAYTAMAQERLKEASGQSRAGRKLEKPVFAFSLAWHPEQSPSREHMLETARKAITVLGLGEHETVIVAHRDEPQKHVHVIVNRVHPLTGMAGDIRNSKRKLSDFAREYERADGKIYCQQREDNHRQRAEGEPTRYADPHIVEAWQTTDCGKAFVAALAAKGYTLAQGRKRLVIIDPHGKACNPTRHLPGVRAADFKARLRDLDLGKLPDADSPPPPADVMAKAEKEAERQRRLAEFDAKAKSQTDALAQRQAQAATALALQQDRHFVSAKKRLAGLYGLPQKKKALLEMHCKVENAPWWKRLLGISRQERKALAEHKRAFIDALTVYREKVSHIREQNERVRTEITSAHGRERSDLADTIARRRTSLLNALERAAPEHQPSLDVRRHFNETSTESDPKEKSEKWNSRRMDLPPKSYHR